ncbi:phospholipase D-like domain-containing protein [Caballeronia sp. LZ008]|uniref:helicase-related protein n=1 Tax=unclassified Caballeronia TaxID=2646786 RepID=UPI00202970E2|nr:MULTISPECIES: helicase-related protein [unclassified Caballeronia]MDR5794500.1 phospholipase D-like domain-containing protein [Caballeronia sp. LZ008]
MLSRHSSRLASLYETFLKPRLAGAHRYDRIAGYFQSSLLELANESLASVPRIRIVCNTEVSADDVKTVRMATGARRKELEEGLLRLAWNAGHFPHVVEVHGSPAQRRLKVLHDMLLASGKDGRLFEIRLVPDAEFGFVHGKGGVIEGTWGKTSFIGSANDSSRAWTQNYELVWEDDDPQSVKWLQDEFEALWAKAFPLSEFIVKQIGRLSQRTVIEHVGRWKEKPEPEPLLAEVPTATELFGFWDHQKYFINLAFQEHLKYRRDSQRGARFLLCDGVGLGKTLQLGAIAKLIGTLDSNPILIMAPKPLLEQWQEELMSKLAIPSARWEEGGWLTERDEFHPALPGKAINCPRKIGIVSTSVVTSAARSERNRMLVEQLLGKHFSCVIWDEAHRIRRGNLAASNVYSPADKKLLYQFAEELAGRAKTLLLATATPVQLHSMELWDLLYILSINNPQVLGTANSLWRRVDGPEVFDIVAGRKDVNSLYDKWQYWRNPLPSPLDAKTEVFDWVRHDLGLRLTDCVATSADQDLVDEARKFDLEFLQLRELNPFTQWVVKRSRDRLETEGKLVKIEMVPHGDGQPILCSHSMEQAFEIAEDFAKTLHHRVKAGGFIKTLLQRRVGSSLVAGLRTTEKMLAGKKPHDDEDPDEEGDSIYPLEENEKELLQRLRDHLSAHLGREDDPKFERVRDVLKFEFEHKKWIERGVLIFSQFYDSAYALAEYLLRHFDEPIGLYANSSASKLFEDGKIQSVDRKLLKEKVIQGRLKLLIGTDAASTGLNLQRLGCLINLDLPWNPTILEQRKGRVQRGTLAKRIPFYNMRYDKGVEQKLFETLSDRIQEITTVFGTVPDFIVDQWVTDMLDDKAWDGNTVLTIIAERRANPFTLKETTESVDRDWEGTAEVLNETEAFRQLVTGWSSERDV